MEILVTCNLSADGRGNPFVYQFLRSLVRRDEIISVQHGTTWLYDDILFDLIHFHWPAELVHWKEPTTKELRKLGEALARWKSKGVAMVATIHNEYPHYRDTRRFKELYDLVYSHVDGFVHLGGASKRIMRSRYDKYLSRSLELVIPHGDYSWFPNDVSQDQARRALGISSESRVILSFGSVRSPEEIDLLRMVSKKVLNKETELLIAGRFSINSKCNIKYYTTRIPFWINSNVLLADHFIYHDEVQNYLNASDVVLIPRKKALNSGSVALGFTFGKIVVGPDTGNVGEILRATGNPIFDTRSSESVVSALEKGLNLPKNFMRENNRSYAKKNMDWKTIGKMYVAFYKKVLNR